MNTKWIGLVLFASLTALVVAPVQAQPVSGSRVFSARELSAVKWPSYRRLGHNQYVSEFAAIQYLLRNQGFYKSQPDGKFGPQTDKAIRAFQRAKGLKVDGIIGPQTWPKLLPRLHSGDRGDAVRAVQVILVGDQSESGERTYPQVVVDGVFGKKTEAAVRGYQTYYNDLQVSPARHFKVDGVVGAQTWCILFGGEIAGFDYRNQH